MNPTPARTRIVRVADEVAVSISADRVVTVHVEGRDVPTDTITLMVALGADPAPWHDVVHLLRAWAEHAPDLPVEDAWTFATLPGPAQRTLAASGALPGDPLLALAVHDPDPDTRAAAATAVTATPGMDSAVRGLARDEHWWVRDRVAAAPTLPADVVDLLAADPSQDVRVSLIRAGHRFSPTTYEVLANGPERVRAALARRTETF